MKRITIDPAQLAYNKEVKRQYYKLLKQTKQLIALIERHELRYTLQRTSIGPIAPFQIVHEFVSPIVYLSLRSEYGERYSIHWGFEQFDDDCGYSHITGRFVRLLYTLTATEHTSVIIEDCIHTDSIVTHCSEVYECVDENNHYHKFVLIPYKPTVAKRKQMRAVA